MSIQLPRAWRFACQVAKVSAFITIPCYLHVTTRRVRAGQRLGITDEDDVALPSFTESSTIRNYVNPHGKASGAVDMHTVTLNVPLDKGISDETILAQATKSFFNGWVFYPEAKALSLIKLGDFKYNKLASTTVPAHIWSAAEISETALPELHTVLFGAFRLADVHLADAETQATTGSKQSHADFLFGSDMSEFCGCHRFSVERLEVDASGETQKVKVQMQSYACNPQSDVPGGKVILGFHRLYASLLFRETVGEVHRGLASAAPASAS
ncbi:hypothetical protein NLG97_g4486 [Lecanicillium saksenae]|uniref:Uncharacterized protein n=1 Tax=Lecanicillium saksenae TaxID=468837 RepID=A0ACC1QWT9_9HYPO|nr:hypothetical protein NLG97_g4486 [Lecanicillium saksenae]